MIDKEILDAVLPLPTLDELKEQKVEELKDEGFVISNFHSGGVFYTMLMIVLRIKVEVIELLRVVLNNTVIGDVAEVQLVDKDGDIIASAGERVFTKTPGKGLYIAFKYNILEVEVESSNESL